MLKIIGISDMKISNDPEITLVTYSLGSCIGLTIYDPVVKVGGILHYMLPESSLDAQKAKLNPFMFADTGIPLLFKETYKLGAKKNRMKVIVAGGSQILDQKGFFNIGKRNDMAIRKMLHRNNVIVDYNDTGGNTNRTVRLEVQTGNVWIRTGKQGERMV